MERSIYDPDIIELSNFVKQVVDDIDSVILIIDKLLPEHAPTEISIRLRKAWDEAESNKSDIQKYLSRERTQSQYNWFVRKLQKAGLTGQQLKLKLFVWKYRRGQIERLREEFDGALTDGNYNIKNVLVDALKIYFGLVNHILKSMIFIPGVDAIDEIKGILENILL